MNKRYWLFARPIYSDSQHKNEINYYEYYRHSNNNGLSFGYKSTYIDNSYPCLILKNLFTDLFSGSEVYHYTTSSKRLVVVRVPKLIDNVQPEAKDLIYFFPFFNKRKEYESRFRQRKGSAFNPYANQLYSLLTDSSKNCLKEIESACKIFFREDCTILDADELNDYLISRIEIFIDYIVDNGRFSIVEKSSKELMADSIRQMRLGLEGMRGNLPMLLSRVLVLGGLDWDRIDSLMMERLLSGKKSIGCDLECDRFYTAYCEENKTDPGKLRAAYEGLSHKSKYYKEIIYDQAHQLIKFGSDEKKSLGFKIISRLSEKYTDYGPALSLLAYCHSKGIGCPICEAQARLHYEQAAKLGDGDALLVLAEEAYASQSINTKLEAECLCQKILDMAIPQENIRGRAAFIIAEIYHKLRMDNQRAQEYYVISARSSYEPAKHRLRQLNRPNRHSAVELKQIPEEEYCERHLIASGCEDVIESIRSKIKSAGWQMRLIGEKDPCDMRQIICDYIDKEYSSTLSIEEYPTRSVFVFAESDEEVNLHHALYLLDRLYSKYSDIVIDDDSDSSRRISKLIDSFDIYLSADFETASMMIDASIAEMGDEVYFRVHICDSNKDLAEQLLYRAPLFIPTIRGEGDPSVVVFGSSDFTYSFIREATASCYMINHNIKITAIDGNISRIENRFKQNCGGIYTAGLRRGISPVFLSYDLSRADLDDIVSARPIGKDPTINDAKQSISEANYFVVDVGSDMDNVLFAKKLRAWLLRSDSKFRRMPFIAVRCRDSVNAFWISRLHSGTKHNPHWYNDYDLYIFGMISDIYPSVITDNLVEKIALGVHLSYDSSPTKEEIAHFWQSTYSRDSSRATAVGLVYRMFDGGIYPTNYRDYHSISFEMMSQLADRYVESIHSSGRNIISLAAAEQSRWNCFMLSRGWLPASAEQVRAYREIGGHISHKHELCKLHPYIRDWEDIDGDDESSIEKARSGISSSSPKVNTIKSIIDTRIFFNEPSVKPSYELDVKR